MFIENCFKQILFILILPFTAILTLLLGFLGFIDFILDKIDNIY